MKKSMVEKEETAVCEDDQIKMQLLPFSTCEGQEWARVQNISAAENDLRNFQSYLYFTLGIRSATRRFFLEAFPLCHLFWFWSHGEGKRETSKAFKKVDDKFNQLSNNNIDAKQAKARRKRGGLSVEIKPSTIGLTLAV